MRILIHFLFLGIIFSCVSSPKPKKRTQKLSKEDIALLRKAEKEVIKGGINWKKTLKDLCKNNFRAKVFAKGLIGWLVRDFERLGLHPDIFGEELKKNRNGIIWQRILKALRFMGDTPIDPLMDLIVNGKDPFARNMGAEILGRLGNLGIKQLEKEINKNNPQIAYAAARALSLKKGYWEAFSILRNTSLNHKNPIIRGSAAYYLGKFGGKQALDVLIEILKSEKDEFVKRKAVAGIGELKYKEAVPLIILYLEEEKKKKDTSGIQTAIKTLRSLTGRNFGSNIKLWKLYWTEEAKRNGGI